MKKINKNKGYFIVAIFWLAVLTLWSTRSQAQTNNWCDSLSYSIFPNTTLTVTPSSGGIGNMVGAIDWSFTACNDVACYVGQGNNPYSFPLIQISDTVKLCYDAFIYQLDSTIMMCNYCDSVVYDFNLFTWVVMLRNTPTGIPGFVIEEDGIRWYNDIAYDMLGKALTDEIPIGTIYFKGGKKYIRLK
jgi:hypothetical protein|tara:strand:- start:23085 stop:23648 length:564 start_codon:yes stop_codon:yes gene_type:complete